jgi:hypothetical protein
MSQVIEHLPYLLEGLDSIFSITIIIGIMIVALAVMMMVVVVAVMVVVEMSLWIQEWVHIKFRKKKWPLVGKSLRE